MKNTVFYLFGFPGTGKLTIAKELCRQAGLILVDNQTINMPLFKVVGVDGKTKLPARIWDNARAIWNAVFDTMIHIAPAERSYVLTNVLVNEDDDDMAWFRHVETVAKKKGAIFVPVRLTCSLEEMEKRITRPERKERMKEMNPKAPKEYMEKYTILEPDHANLLSLDVTEIDPKDAAIAILNHAGNCE